MTSAPIFGPMNLSTNHYFINVSIFGPMTPRISDPWDLWTISNQWTLDRVNGYSEYSETCL